MALTLEEKRARDREYQRKHRAKTRSSAAATAAATSDTSDASDPSNPQPLEKYVRDSIALMKQVDDSDSALVEQAYGIARLIDRLVSTNDLMWSARIISGHQALARILRELGATPIARQQYEFRSRKLTPSRPEAIPNADIEDEDREAIVSPLRRPEKRRRRQGR